MNDFDRFMKFLDDLCTWIIGTAVVITLVLLAWLAVVIPICILVGMMAGTTSASIVTFFFLMIVSGVIGQAIYMKQNQ